MHLISVIVPCKDEQESLPLFYQAMDELGRTMEGIEFEMIFVDDGSEDTTLHVLKEMRQQDERVRFISFSRNFGKEAAILAGLRHSRGDFVTIMDADLQDPPGLLPLMYQALTAEGYESAVAYRTSRAGESPLRSFLSNQFYRVFNWVTKAQLKRGVRDYRLMSRRMVDALLELSEVNRFSKGLMNWVGFKTKWIPYANVERVAGHSKWSLPSLMKYSLDAIADFSTAPLSLSSVMGFVFCLASLVWTAHILVRTVIEGNPTPGWASLACILLFSSGINFFMTGILGQYVARTYMETKQRPAYLVAETEH